jgi:hypothetical protein
MNLSLLRLYALSNIKETNIIFIEISNLLKQNVRFIESLKNMTNNESYELDWPTNLEKYVHTIFAKSTIGEKKGLILEPDWKWLFNRIEWLYSVRYKEYISLVNSSNNPSTLELEDKKEWLKEQKMSAYNMVKTGAKEIKQTLIWDKAYITVVVIEECWKIIKQYFPILDWGLPDIKLLEAMGNIILGYVADSTVDWSLSVDKIIETNKEKVIGTVTLKIEEYNPYIKKFHDPYSLAQSLQIEYLIRRLKELGVEDLEKEMEENGVFNDILILEEILKKTPAAFIKLDPSNYMGRRTVGEPKEMEDKLIAEVKKAKVLNEDMFDIKGLTHKFITYHEKLDEYILPLANDPDKPLGKVLKNKQGFARKKEAYLRKYQIDAV